MSEIRWIASLVAKCPLINPSLLAADFGNLEREIRRIEQAGAQILHLDIMDGHFVPNLSVGIPVVEAVRRITELPLDVHLMLSEPQKYVKPFRKAGADVITVHIEVLDDPRPLLDEIRQLGAAAGLAHNPPTPMEKSAPFLRDADLVLTMSVMPGFGGQVFDPAVLEKIAYIREHSAPNTLISVDGGVNENTIADCARAGANLFVAGTSVFGTADYAERMRFLTNAAMVAP
ncbi:MAG: ribulose-phosphate 3-epimerase [Planctomycetaceae bacterium]|nr:ribulose-phosphate 3-epimerase [Planctomycetaceae bacterium]